jgi:hypothetical protein
VVAALAAVWLAEGARAGTLYDFSFGFGQYTASGALLLSDAVGVGEAFDVDDVESFELELFNNAISVGAATFPPFPGFDVIEGTRNASDLSMSDLVVSDPFNISFGCTGSNCLFTGEIFFTSAPGNRLEFGTPAAALASFVFTEVPEPDATLLFGAALVTLAALRSARPSLRSADPVPA